MSAAPGSLECFARAVRARLGLSLAGVEERDLEAVLEERLRRTGCHDPRRYVQLLDGPGGDGELAAVAARLTVSETYFYRDPGQLRALVEHILPELAARRGRRPIRALSAGCASGEEPYTLALLGREHGRALEITAIDVNARLVARAEHACYRPWSLRKLADPERERLFRRVGDDFCLPDDVRAAVRFEARNLLDEDPSFWAPGRFDLILCRNVIMYLEPPAARAVVGRFARATAEGGYLLLGHAEHLRGISSAYVPCTSGDAVFYRLRPAAGPGPAPAARLLGSSPPPPAAAAQPAPATAATATKEAPPREDLLDRARAAIAAERYDEAGALLGALSGDHDPEALLLRATAGVHRGQLEQAGRDLDLVLARRPLEPVAYYLRALCHEDAGRIDDARRDHRGASYLDPRFALPHLHLARLARRAGQRAAARRELLTALELLPREDGERLALLGGGFGREALIGVCRAELRALHGGGP